jgi:hypothetical protein
MPKSKAQPPDPKAHIRDLALRLIGTDHGRDYWMSHPNAELNGKSPQELIDGGRADIVEQYLDAALEGDFG